jgi:UDP-glucose 4-epimerase
MSLNVLVTGGAGFIGSHTIVELLNVGHKVICVDNCCNAYLAEGEKLPESLKRVQEITGKTVTFDAVDIRDKKALDGVFKKVSFYFFILIFWRWWRWQV